MRKATYPDPTRVPVPLAQVPDAVFKIEAALRYAGGRASLWKLKSLGYHHATLQKYILWMIALGVVRPTGDATAAYELVYASNREWIDWSQMQEAMEMA
ncbi:MAG: hypothetical protein KIS63_13020 [Caldilineales bacterium]|jgi:hypothetical protein|nr:hypothetical protein [Caldilineales bacterium]